MNTLYPLKNKKAQEFYDKFKNLIDEMYGEGRGYMLLDDYKEVITHVKVYSTKKFEETEQFNNWMGTAFLSDEVKKKYNNNI